MGRVRYNFESDYVINRNLVYGPTDEQVSMGVADCYLYPYPISPKDNLFSRDEILRIFRNQFIIVKGAKKNSIYDNPGYVIVEVLWAGCTREDAERIYATLKGYGQGRCEIFDIETYKRLTGYMQVTA